MVIVVPPLSNVYILPNSPFFFSLVVQIEMRTTTQNIALTKADEGVMSVLEARKSCDVIVHHEVKELGQHT